MMMLSTRTNDHIDRTSEMAAAAIHANYYDDIRYNLQDILSQENDPNTVTPYHLILALNRTGVLNSFLEHTDCSAEAMLEALAKLYDHLYYTRKENTYSYVREDDIRFTESCICTADLIRSIVSEEQAKGAPKIVQQECELSSEMKEKIPSMADELFCHALITDTLKREESLVNLVQQVTPPQEALERMSNATRQRHFLAKLCSARNTALARQTCHYSNEDQRGQLLIGYILGLIERDFDPSKADIDDQVIMGFGKKIFGEVLAEAKATSQQGFFPTI